MEPKLNVALVHGAWADGSSWDAIAKAAKPGRASA
jgi:hypothetical protein